MESLEASLSADPVACGVTKSLDCLLSSKGRNVQLYGISLDTRNEEGERFRGGSFDFLIAGTAGTHQQRKQLMRFIKLSKLENPKLRVVLVEPRESPLFPCWGEEFRLKRRNTLVSSLIRVPSSLATNTSRFITEGIGTKTGFNGGLATTVALQLAKTMETPCRIAALLYSP